MTGLTAFTTKQILMVFLTAYVSLFESVAVFGQNAASVLDPGEYVARVLAESPACSDATQNAENAQMMYEDAVLSQQSAYTIGLLAAEATHAQAQQLLVQNMTVIQAFQNVFSSMGATKSLEFARMSEEIAAAAYARNEALATKEYVSVRDTLTARIAYLQATAATRNAINTDMSAQKTLIREINGDYARLEIVPFALGAEMPDLPSLSAAVDSDATVAKHRRTLQLHRERRTFIASSDAFPPSELEEIEETISQTELQLKQRIWAVEDAVEQLQLQITANSEAMVIVEINLQVKAMDQRQAEHQYENGDIYASDVAQAELNTASASEQLTGLERDRFLLVLESLNRSQISLVEWVADSIRSE